MGTWVILDGQWIAGLACGEGGLNWEETAGGGVGEQAKTQNNSRSEIRAFKALGLDQSSHSRSKVFDSSIT